ncbi:MAG: response regulator [Candidatus Sumerlaeia bacterium]|nr:response regulator [Candidatus Sumerlaeia bacterium]
MADRYRILAVDDHDDILELIRMTLDPDYDVVTLNSAVELYELMDLFEPDLLILDIMMPRITGYQLVEILRKNPVTKDLPIIILSARSAASDIKHGYRLGATLYLTKPFQPERLLKNVKTQFDYNPPASRKKSLAIEDFSAQVSHRPAFKKGHISLGQGIPIKNSTVDARKLIESKIRRQYQAENKGSNPT